MAKLSAAGLDAGRFLVKKIKLLSVKNKKTFDTIFCAVSAVIFVLLFSYSTSPLYPNYLSSGMPAIFDDGMDSAIFMTIGKYWTLGYVPYRDLFDHKGPVIFLVNAIGFIVGGGERYGICLIQIISLFASLFFLLKILHMLMKHFCVEYEETVTYKIFPYLSVVFTLILYTFAYISGNQCLEYNLPFICISVYFLLQFLLSDEVKHPAKISFVYGISIGVCFMTLLINGAMIYAGVLAAAAKVLKNREFKNLFQNIGLALLGFFLIVIPFCIYFACEGAFDDFIYATFTYNFLYIAETEKWIFSATVQTVFAFAVFFCPYTLAVPLFISAFRKKNFRLSLMFLLAFAMESPIFFGTSSYLQYIGMCIIQFPIFLCMVWFPLTKALKNFLLVSVFAVLFISAMAFCRFADEYVTVNAESSYGYEEIMETWLDEIESGTFITYGQSSFNRVYLRYNLDPGVKYFILQEWQLQFSSDLKEDVVQNFEETKLDWILVYLGYGDDSFIWDFLGEYYELVEESGYYALYHIL